MEGLIEREIAHCKDGKSSHIIFKMNSLVDDKIIRLLYQASKAGVKIDLIVRGICCLRPGIKDVSENIRVVSILGRFLEHSRVYYFSNGGNEEIYVGSADLMPRNLDRRVEVVFPVEDPGLSNYIKDHLLEIYLNDNVRARIMDADGNFTRLPVPEGQEPLDCQRHFLETDAASWADR